MQRVRLDRTRAVFSSFNPHPPVGAGATGCSFHGLSPCGRFQSSPARGGGCNRREHHAHAQASRVSILTRLWGGCNEQLELERGTQQLFQSSPARGGGCNSARSAHPRRAFRFNPHPPVGAGATSAEFSVANNLVMFQSSPARGGGCNPYTAGVTAAVYEVSILTRPWGRVQRGLENARERFPKRKCSSCQGVPCRALGG